MRPLSPAAFAACVGVDPLHEDALGAPPAHIQKGLNDDLKGERNFAPSFADRVADGCGVMGLVREPPGKIDQPTWYHAIQVLAKCEDGQVKAHEWSAKDPRYSERETQANYDRASAHGPTSCAKFADLQPAICGGCPHSGKITGPILLGVESHKVQPLVQGATTRIPHRMTEDAAVALAKDRFAFITDFRGSPSIVALRAGRDPRPISPQQFKLWTSNVFVTLGEGESRKILPFAQWWLASPQRLEYDLAVYDPEGFQSRPGDRVLNLYRGFARIPAQGSWGRMRGHLLHVVCRGDRRAFRYLIYWMAHLLQHPGSAPGTVIVLKSSREGTGKSTVGAWMTSWFGPHALTLNSPENLTGRFNVHLEGISAIVLNEPHFPGSHADGRKLKSMITDPTWTLEQKGGAVYSVPNIAHIMLTTNEGWAIPAGDGARRWAVFEVDESMAGNHHYFDLLHHEANHGGIEAMMFALLELDISKFEIRDVPRTTALIEQQLLSAQPEVQWALDLAESEDGSNRFGAPASTEDLYRAYDAYVLQRRLGRSMAKTAFGRWLGALNLSASKVGPSRVNGWILPDADTFRTAVVRNAGIHSA